MWFLPLAVLCPVSTERWCWHFMTPWADSTPSASLLWCLTINIVVIRLSVNVAGLGQNLEVLNVTPGNYWASSVAENNICYKRNLRWNYSDGLDSSRTIWRNAWPLVQLYLCAVVNLFRLVRARGSRFPSGQTCSLFPHPPTSTFRSPLPEYSLLS